MEKMHEPFVGSSEKNRKKALDKEDQTGFTGLVYDVDHNRLHVVYEDPETGRIRIECRCQESNQEPRMSISAA
jgi:hypothetical protein